jgi:aromatic-L-amino-acid/L-tryptophan decarboxylase
MDWQAPHPSDQLLERLSQVEPSARQLEPSRAQWQQWLAWQQEYAEVLLCENRDGLAWRLPDQNPYQLQATFSIRQEPSDCRQLQQELLATADGAGLNPASGGHLGYIPGGGLPASAVGDFLTDISNRYAGIAFTSPGAVALEHFLIDWMARLFQLPSTAGGTLTSGGSIANLVAITTARDARQISSAEVPRAVIYASPQMHHCLDKALRIAGLREAVLRKLPLDASFRMQPHVLAEQIAADRRAGLRPWLLVASAGTTDTGAIDPLAPLGELARQEGLWFHIDAAYGGFFYLLESVRERLTGIASADSLVVDPHKGLFLPYGTGAVLVRRQGDLQASFAYQASYLQDALEGGLGASPADLSAELTRHFRGPRLYFPLKLHGLAPFLAALEEKLLLCRYFYQQVQRLGYQVGPEPDLSVCTFRHPSRCNATLLKAILADGRLFLSSTSIDGEFWLRLAVLSFRTHRQQIDLLLELLR